MTELAELLIKTGADVNTVDAVRIASTPCTRVCNVCCHAQNGWSPLMWALEKSNNDLATSLIEAGANLNQPDEVRTYALLVSRRGYVYLIGSSQHGITVLAKAQEKANQAMCDLIQTRL